MIFKRKKKSHLDKLLQQFRQLFSLIGLWAKTSVGRWTGELKRQAVMARMKKADIILASPRTGRLSPIALIYRLVLGAHYVHSMLYIGEGEVIHTTSRYGVVVGRLPRKIYKKDRYAIFRVKDLNPERQECVVEKALKWRKQKLDYASMFINIPTRLLGLRKKLLFIKANRIWCSRLIYKSFQAAGIELMPEQKSRNIISEDIAHSSLTIRI